jgi:hypothetical protein
MNTVHYIWIGGSEIPSLYLTNYQKCVQLNPLFEFKIWRNEECLQLVSEYGLMETFTPLSFICKIILMKYIILHKFGGIYTDFDIEWKVPFNEISQKYNFPKVDLVVTHTLTPVMDDPFIISKPNIFGGCISYCKNRTELKYDGELYVETGKMEISKLEPFGSFGLTEWLKNSTIKFEYFPQQGLLDNNGKYGNHIQNTSWKSR